MSIFLLSILVCVLCPAVLLLAWAFVATVFDILAYLVGGAFLFVVVAGCIIEPRYLLLFIVFGAPLYGFFYLIDKSQHRF